MHQNSPFADKKSKNFLGRGHGPLPTPLPQWGREHPLLTPHPLGTSALAFGARTPPNYKTVVAPLANARFLAKQLPDLSRLRAARMLIIQKLNYRKQTTRQLRTQYVEGIYRPIGLNITP